MWSWSGNLSGATQRTSRPTEQIDASAVVLNNRVLSDERGETSVPTLNDFTATTITGDQKSLGDFSGQVALVVNTASQCGFTPQFEGLEKLHQEYADQGLVVLGFPCNQFG